MMKHTVWFMLLVTSTVALAAYLKTFPRAGGQAVAAPPLSLEGFLDEKLPMAPAGGAEIKADNFSCFVCHANYQEEEFVLAHAKEDIGCIECHGPSHAHRDDEGNVTPPDVMYPSEEIKKNCAKCHEDHDVPARKVIARWQQRCPTITDPGKIVCTDCHGQHRLKRRTVRWNKRTGKLLAREEPAAQVAPTTTKSEGQ